jgi:hypothetical protein
MKVNKIVMRVFNFCSRLSSEDKDIIFGMISIWVLCIILFFLLAVFG